MDVDHDANASQDSLVYNQFWELQQYFSNPTSLLEQVKFDAWKMVIIRGLFCSLTSLESWFDIFKI